MKNYRLEGFEAIVQAALLEFSIDICVSVRWGRARDFGLGAESESHAFVTLEEKLFVTEFEYYI